MRGGVLHFAETSRNRESHCKTTRNSGLGRKTQTWAQKKSETETKNRDKNYFTTRASGPQIDPLQSMIDVDIPINTRSHDDE